MNKLAIAVATCVAFGAYAENVTTEIDTNNAETVTHVDTNAVVAVTRMADGTPNTWTLADLQAALGLLNRKYHREVERPEGRRAWHGKLVREIVDTNGLEKVEVYEDGSRFTFPFVLRDSPAAISNRNAQLKVTMSKGMPKALAAARARRMDEKATTNIVNVVTGPGAEVK